ncbi:hypothetical protein HYW84_03445 [Candidatus Peregrinibacteria bacterium]|nr:hypothetical protein [Candidatus Peregrinibacteria bacterium]
MTGFHTDTGERLVHVCDEHWIKYIAPASVSLFLFAVSALLFALAGISAHHYMLLSHATFISALLLFLLTFHWLFVVLLSEALDRIIITNKRLLLIQYRLIFHEDILEISFDKMKTVEARKHGFIQNLFHYGTLIFETNKASVRLVPHPNRVARIIQEAMAG